MLIIVNPYATTVSARLRNLVVYALQGRYEVDAVATEARGHATELCREAATRAMTSWSPSVAMAPSTKPPTACSAPHPLTCLPGGSTNVFGKMLGIPGSSSTPPSTCWASPMTGVRARSMSAWSTTAASPFASGLGLDASVQRVDEHPRLKARLGACYFAWSALGTFVRRYLLKPPRLEAHVPRGGWSPHAGVEAYRDRARTARPSPYFQDRPIEIAEGATLDSGTLAGCVLHRATPVDAVHRLAGLLGACPRGPPSPGHRLSGASPS